MKSYCPFFDVFLIVDSDRDVIFSIDIVDQKPQSLPMCSPHMVDAFQSYIDSPHKPFDLNFNAQGSPFQQKVFQALMDIPSGEVRSYKEIAEAIGHPKAYRAVGHACHINPLPIIIPCHRVVGSSHLGGYAYGLEFKQRLLHHEKKA